MRTILLTLLTASTVFGQAKPACDRACLEGWIDRYLDAMLARDASKVPFAKDYKFTENGQRLIPPDGLWNTITAKGAYRTFVTDVEGQSVAMLGSIQEMNAGAMLGLRLKIRNNQITEAEQFIQRSPSSATGFERIGYKWTDPIPAAERVSRAGKVWSASRINTSRAWRRMTAKASIRFQRTAIALRTARIQRTFRRLPGSRALILKQQLATPRSGVASNSSKAASYTS